MKKILKMIFIVIILNNWVHPLYSQIKQSHSIIFSFLQLKEKFNIGMVFNGIQLKYVYGITWKIEESELTYQPSLAFGIAWSHEMTGYKISISPVNISWQIPVFQNNGHTLKTGVNFSGNYNYQMYPDLHGGHLFWASEIGLSPTVNYRYQFNHSRFIFSFQNSLLGFVSHTEKNDPYFYSFKASDFFIRPHENMKFGSFNNYDHTKISIEFIPSIDRIHSFLYEFDYLGIWYKTKFEQINHSLIWRMTL
jgi:hypothetical protein